MIIKGVSISNARIVGEIIKLDCSLLSDLESKVFDGKILVIKNLTPDIVLYIDKIIGIIAEVGGYTSHAAIIARELGIPCIVSAEGCMKLLQNGDKVILDGEQSSVEVL